MNLLSIEEIRNFIPNSTEIKACANITTCRDADKRLCSEKDKPCYVTFNNDELEGTIKLNFKTNMVVITKMNEDNDYAKIIRPDGIETEVKGKKKKDTVKKMLELFD